MFGQLPRRTRAASEALEGCREPDARLDVVGQDEAPGPPVGAAAPVRAIPEVGERERAERDQVDVRERHREHEVGADPVPEVPLLLARPVPGQVRAHQRLAGEADRVGMQAPARVAEIDRRRELALDVDRAHGRARRAVEDREMIGQPGHASLRR